MHVLLFPHVDAAKLNTDKINQQIKQKSDLHVWKLKTDEYSQSGGCLTKPNLNTVNEVIHKLPLLSIGCQLFS